MHDPDIPETLSLEQMCHLMKTYYSCLYLSEIVLHIIKPEQIGIASTDITQQESYQIEKVNQCWNDQAQEEGERRDENRK